MQNIYKVHNYFKLIYINIILIMKSVNKSFDVNEVFAGVEKSFKEYNSVSSGKGNIFEKGEAWVLSQQRLSVGLLIFLEMF